jgi:hypothetical protein
MKYLIKKQLKTGKNYFGSQFQRLQSTVIGSVVRQKIVVGRAARKQRERGREQGHSPGGLLPPTRPHLLISSTS